MGKYEEIKKPVLENTGKKMVEDFSNRKTSNAKTAVLKMRLRLPGYCTL
jgi:hypothetical protein